MSPLVDAAVVLAAGLPLVLRWDWPRWPRRRPYDWARDGRR